VSLATTRPEVTGRPGGTHKGTVRRVDGARTNTRNSPTYPDGGTIFPRRLANLNSLFSFEITVTSRCTFGLCVPEGRSVTSGHIGLQRDQCPRQLRRRSGCRGFLFGLRFDGRQGALDQAERLSGLAVP
jgi:hypothetical protein